LPNNSKFPTLLYEHFSKRKFALLRHYLKGIPIGSGDLPWLDQNVEQGAFINRHRIFSMGDVENDQAGIIGIPASYLRIECRLAIMFVAQYNGVRRTLKPSMLHTVSE